MINVIGAGMAGLLAANMLGNRVGKIWEAQKYLPNNHSALLRFRSDAVSQELRIPFKKVRVLKSIFGSRDPIEDAIAYARKISNDGKLELRSILNIDIAERFIAPPDLIMQMAEECRDSIGYSRIEYGQSVDLSSINPSHQIISTVPMPVLMDLLKYEDQRPDFKYLDGGTMSIEIGNCNIYVTRYVPYKPDLFYRVSITGNKFIGEFVGSDVFLECPSADYVLKRYFGLQGRGFGQVEYKPQKYAKINYLSSEDRRKAERFMMWATVNFGIYSLGRFATWRAGLLLDDLVHDIRKIEGWIDQGNYHMLKER